MHHHGTLRAEREEGGGKFLNEPGVIHATEPGRGSCRIQEGTEKIEDGGKAEIAPDSCCVPENRVIQGCKEKPKPYLFDNRAGQFRGEIDSDAQCFKDIGRAT
jgi:hypothetical protein